MSSTTKRIIVTVTNDLNQDQRMHRICSSMQSLGYDVLLVGRLKQNSKPLLTQSFEQHRIPCFFQSGVGFYAEYNIRLFLLLLRNSCLGLYSVDLDTIVPTTIIGKLKGWPLIHDAHEYFVEVPELNNSRIKKWIWKAIAKWFIPRSNLRITVNNELAELLGEEYKSEFNVIRSVPVLKNISEDVIKDSPKVILYQGVLNMGRGLEEPIGAISSMNDNVELHIVGEGDLSEELRSLKNKVDINNKVKFLGWKDPSELIEITRKAFLGLNLLDSESLNYKYSLANKFFDYMHAGVPSINMKFPVYERFCKEENVGVCLDSLTQLNLTDQIRLLLNDTDKYIEMVHSCEKAKFKFNWGIESEHLNTLVKSVLI